MYSAVYSASHHEKCRGVKVQFETLLNSATNGKNFVKLMLKSPVSRDPKTAWT